MALNIPKYSKMIPHITVEQMIEVDRLMVEKYQIYLLQMMENAGRALALLTKKIIDKQFDKNVKIAVFAGSGGNGGGAMVAARRLSAWGATVSIFLTKPKSKFTGVPLIQLNTLEKMNIGIFSNQDWNPNEEFDIILDGIIGYSLSGVPRGGAKNLIFFANAHPAPVISLDVPSGMESTIGHTIGQAVHASYTLTLALPKTGFLAPRAKENTGRLFLADISVPLNLYRDDMELVVDDLFEQGDIIEIVSF